MRRREDGDIETIRAAYAFIARHEEFGDLRNNGTYRELGRLLDSIDRRATDQVSEAIAGKGASQTWLEVRDDLIVSHMRPIARIARVLEADRPALQALRMPNSYRGVSALSSHAIGMGVEAAKWKDDFIAMGLPADFVEQLNAAVQRFKVASATPREHRAARRGATDGAQAELKQAKKWLRVLDAFVKSAVPNDVALLAEWRAVKRFPARKKAAVEPPAQITDAPAPLMLPQSTEPLQLTARVVEPEPAERSALSKLRTLFRI